MAKSKAVSLVKIELVVAVQFFLTSIYTELQVGKESKVAFTFDIVRVDLTTMYQTNQTSIFQSLDILSSGCHQDEDTKTVQSLLVKLVQIQFQLQRDINIHVSHAAVVMFALDGRIKEVALYVNNKAQVNLTSLLVHA